MSLVSVLRGVTVSNDLIPFQPQTDRPTNENKTTK